MERLLDDWGIAVTDLEIANEQVDGGAVWDDGHGPMVFSNRSSRRAKVPWGKRMVLAHELCHLLFDRARAVPLMVVSGEWTSPVMERRANAFAAELLLPRKGVLELLGPLTSPPDEAELDILETNFGIGKTACFRHVCNRFSLTELM